MDEQNTIHDLSNLFNAHTKVEAARNASNAAGYRVELEKIRERMYELRSQHEPLETLTGGDAEQRQNIIDAIFYVVIGRFPNNKKPHELKNSAK